jgi:hypothetical protein
MKIWTLSDLHLDHAPWQPPEPPPDADVLVVAGDVREGALPALEWLRYDSGWQKPIVYVLGNHEFYHSSLERERDLARDYAAVSGIHVLDDSECVIGGVRFVGGTLWTDYSLYADGDDAEQSRAMYTAFMGLSDHAAIRTRDFSSEVFEPRDALEQHRRTRDYIESVLRVPHAGPTVVVTHHAPSQGSIAPRFAGDTLSAAFASDLEPLMLRHRPAAWLHGHVHSSHDYVVGGTRVVCNPRGYGDENAEGFVPGLVIEINDKSRAYAALAWLYVELDALETPDDENNDS